MLTRAEVDAIKLKQLEDARKPQPGFLDNPLVKAAIGAGVGYLSGGLLPAVIEGLPGATAVAGPVTAAQSAAGATTLPSVGGGITAALAPSSTTLLPAVEGAIKGLGSKTPEEAALGGLEKGALPTIQEGSMKAFGKMGLTPSSVKVGDTTYGLSLPKQIEELNKATSLSGAPSGYQMTPYSYGGKLGIKPVKLATSSTAKPKAVKLSDFTADELAAARTAIGSVKWRRMSEQEKIVQAKAARVGGGVVKPTVADNSGTVRVREKASGQTGTMNKAEYEQRKAEFDLL